jgi:hypothetical protein
MTIPSDFYERFRLNTSFLAAGTGIVMGYFASIFLPFINPIAVVFIGAVISVLVNQWIVHDYFKGKMRGTFEYVYRESLLESSINSAISSARSGPGEMILELESLSLYKGLMTRADAQSEEARFICYLAAAKAANAGGEDRNSITALKLAITLRPKDVVANFRLARAFERIGSAKETIEAYEAALLDPSIDSEALKGFIAAQVQRVTEKGPEQRSPIPGLIYQLM